MMQACQLTFFSAKAPDENGRQGENLALLEAGTGKITRRGGMRAAAGSVALSNSQQKLFNKINAIF